MKVIVDARTEEILGASILGVHGDEAIHCVLDTMSARGNADTLRRTMHIHPTVSELIPTVFGELTKESEGMISATRSLGGDGPALSAFGLGCVSMSEFYGPYRSRGVARHARRGA